MQNGCSQKMQLLMLSVNCWPFCTGLNMLVLQSVLRDGLECIGEDKKWENFSEVLHRSALNAEDSKN